MNFRRPKVAWVDAHKNRAGCPVDPDLILIATGDLRFAIWGDQGIHQKAGQPLWDKARRVLEDGLRAGKRGEAVEACVAEVGRALAEHFPADGPRANELPDDVTGD